MNLLLFEMVLLLHVLMVCPTNIIKNTMDSNETIESIIDDNDLFVKNMVLVKLDMVDTQMGGLRHLHRFIFIF